MGANHGGEPWRPSKEFAKAMKSLTARTEADGWNPKIHEEEETLAGSLTDSMLPTPPTLGLVLRSGPR